MSLFVKSSNDMEAEALDLMRTVPCGTPVTDYRFSEPGREIEMMDYLYLLRVAGVHLPAWLASNVVGQQFNWQEKSPVQISYDALPEHKELAAELLQDCVEFAVESNWLVASQDENGKLLLMPSIGCSLNT